LTKSDFDILVVGELNVDVLLNGIQALPKIGEEILAQQMTVDLGGSSAIFACNAQALGAKVAFASKIGADQFGQFILEKLAQKGVATEFILQTSAEQTGMSILLNYDQDRSIVTYQGAMATFGLKNIPQVAFQQVKHLHVSSLFLQPQLKTDGLALFQKAKKHQLTTSLDPQWDPAERWDLDWKILLPLVDVFLPNKAELLNITGTETIEQGLQELQPYANTIVVKNGVQGSVLHYEGKTQALPAFHNPDFVDAIGAGDSFDAGFIANFVQGKALAECQKWANLCGAINTTAAGGTAAFEDKNAFQKTMQQMLSSF